MYFVKTLQRALNRQGTEPNEDSSASCSIAGSFISDTITLNGAHDTTTTAKQPKSRVAAPPAAHNKSVQTFLEEAEERKERVNGKRVEGEEEDEEDQEERTENDQDDELDDDDAGPSTTAARLEERRDLMRALNGDLSTLDQLREQKKLLRSIRLRKEELKALEGRRKALEALKKLAQATESPPSEAAPTTAFTTTSSLEDETKLREFESFLNMLKQRVRTVALF